MKSPIFRRPPETSISPHFSTLETEDQFFRKVYCDSVEPSTPQFGVLQWWEGMAVRLPTMYRITRSILAIPRTSCDVERSFLVWKRVRSDKQQSMAEGTHKGYVSFCFNGIVPPP